jgi:MFS superfamily sulfate permease-like transporter
MQTKSSDWQSDILKHSALFCTILIFTLTDFFGVGSKIFPGSNYFSCLVFLVATLFNQMLYPLISGITTGVMASAGYEFYKFSKDIYQKSYTYINDVNLNTPFNAHDMVQIVCVNTFISLSIASLLFAIVCGLCLRYELVDYIKNIPLQAVYSSIISIGASLIINAYIETMVKYQTIYLISYMLLFLVAVIGLIAALKYPNFKFILPSLALSMMIIYNIYTYFAKVQVLEAQSKKFILNLGEDKLDSLKKLKSFLAFGCKSIYVNCILVNLGNIISLVISCVIVLNIHLHSYASYTSTRVDFEKEYKAASICNYFSALSGLPSFVNLFYSLQIFEIGLESRLSSLIGALAVLVAFFIAKMLINYIPIITSQTIYTFLGLNYIFKHVMFVRNHCSAYDCTTIIVSVIVSMTINTISGFFTAVSLSYAYTLSFYIDDIYRRDNKPAGFVPSSEFDQTQIKNIVTVDYILCFATLKKLEKVLSECCNEVTIDLSECPHIDMNANLFLYNFCQNVQNVEIIGNPNNFYLDIFSKLNNVQCSHSSYN